MLKPTTFLLAISLLSYHAPAQKLNALSGKIMDQSTQEPIPFVHVVGTGAQTISDSNGLFSLNVKQRDTLIFSHINFERYSIQISAIPDLPIPIRLERKENLMQELIIRDYLPEEQLKQEMLEYEVEYTLEEVNAINNVQQSTILYKRGYVPEMNSLDNFKYYMKEPQGVTLFSSNPSKGLIKSLKRLSQQKKNYYPHSLRLNKTDTANFKSLHRFIID